MATVTLKQFRRSQFGGASPFGNVTSLKFLLKTIANGSADNSDSGTALAIGDVVDLGPLPEGMELADSDIFVLTGMTASVTGSLGFKYEDGVDSTEVPQDAAYFGAGFTIATAGRYRANTGKLVILPKPARLILTIAGANNAKVSDLKFLVRGELTGPR